MIQTTLAASATALQTEIYVPSVSGVVAGNILFTEREGMKVISVNTANNFVSVQRGYQTGASAHPLGATVYIGSAASFGSVDPSGSVIAGSATPFINLQDGKVWDGSSGTWTLSADPGNGAVPVAVLSKTVTLTDAQIKALPTTAIEIVPAPAAGKAVAFLKGMTGNPNWDLTKGYTNVDAGVSLACRQSAGNDVSSYPHAGDILSALQGSAQLLAFDPNQDAQQTNYQVYPDAPIELKAYNGTAGNFTGGDPANLLKVTVLYTIIDVS